MAQKTVSRSSYESSCTTYLIEVDITTCHEKRLNSNDDVMDCIL